MGLRSFYLTKQTYFSRNQRERISNVTVSYQVRNLRSQLCLDTLLTSTVFLRVLEYYISSLFFTTNRVGMFDVPSNYASICPSSSRLWRRKPSPYRSTTCVVPYKGKSCSWRLIRRIFSLSQSLSTIVVERPRPTGMGDKPEAHFRQLLPLLNLRPKKRSEEINGGKFGPNASVYAALDKSHFKPVARASQQFDEYINSFGMTPSERPAQKANRNDEIKYVGDIFNDESQEEVHKPPTPMRFQKARRTDMLHLERRVQCSLTIWNRAILSVSGGQRQR